MLPACWTMLVLMTARGPSALATGIFVEHTHQTQVPGASYTCVNSTGCELLGRCVGGVCKCHPGFTGPSCAQVDLVPATTDTTNGLAAWPPLLGKGGDPGGLRAYGWGFSAVKDPTAGKTLYHAIANVGCYTPNAGMVDGTFLLHVTGPTAVGPWAAVGVVTPPTTFNGHITFDPSTGNFVIFFRSSGKAPPANWTSEVCPGVSNKTWEGLIAQGTYISAESITDPLGNFVAYSKSMTNEGWTTQPFSITGQDATCGNKSLIDHNSNPSAVVLSSGTVVLAYRYTFRSGSESVNVAVGKNITGPFEAIFPCNYTMTSNTWGEDPFIWQSKYDGSLHMYYHCMRYGHGVPNSPGLHAWSANINNDGRDIWHTTSSPSHQGAYSTNVSLSNGSSSDLLYHRRERPDLLFDDSGIPLAFYSALQETSGPPPSGQGWGWSFGFAQQVNSSQSHVSD